MADKRRGLGRGLGALIPSTPSGDARPVDVFFPGGSLSSAVLTQEPGGDEREGTTPDSPAGVPHARTAPEVPSSERAEAARAQVPTRESEVDAAEHAGIGRQGVTEAQQVPEQEREHSAAPASGVGHPPAAAGDRALVPVPGARFAELPVGAIRPNPRQPRSAFDQDALAELVGSIQEIGVLQPVVVRPVEDPDAAGVAGGAGDQPVYELIMGERRWRATQQAGLATIPAIVRETDDSAMLRDALLENLHRSDLNPLEEAAAYQQLLDDFGCTHEELAARIHRSRPQISNMLRLLRLPPTVQRRVAAGVLSSGHARALLGLADAGAMERLAQRIVAEGLSVRTTEEIVALGGEGVRPVRRPRSTARNEALDGLAAQLSDRLETRVKIELGRSKGRMTVEFASVEDLNRILGTLSPQDASLPA